MNQISEWERHQAQGFRFDYPAKWNFGYLDTAGDGYYLFLPEKHQGTNIVIVNVPQSATTVDNLTTLQAEMVHQITNISNATSVEIDDTTRTRMADHQAIKIEYEFDTEAGNHIYAIQVGTLLVTGQVLSITMSVFPSEDLDEMKGVFDKIVDSTALIGQEQRGEGFTFTCPPTWHIRPLPNAPGEGYFLFPAGEEEGTNILILRVPVPPGQVANPDQLEPLLVKDVEKGQRIKSSEIHDKSRVEVANREAVNLRYTMDMKTGNRIEGQQIGLILPSGEVLTITMSAFPNSSFDDVEEDFKKVLDSVQLTA